MTSILTKLLGADGGYAALITKVNALFDHRHSKDWDTKTATYAVVSTDHLLYADTSGGGFTFTLPASPVAGEAHTFKKIASANTLTIDGDGIDIDGSATLAMTGLQARSIQFDGTEWWIVAGV